MRSGFIAGLLDEARVTGDRTEPSRLLAAIAQDEEPFATLQYWDGAAGFFLALDGDLPFMRRVRAGAPLQEEDRRRWVALLRWWTAQLCAWDPAGDSRCRNLTALLVIAHAHDWDGTLWNGVPADVRENVGLIGLSANVVRSLKFTFDARGGDVVPIWEREAVDRLAAVEGGRNWSGMGDAWRPMQDLIRPNVLHMQTVRFLSRADTAQLADAVAGLERLAAAMLVAQVLDVRQRLELAVASDNHFVEFACAYETLNGRRSRLVAPFSEAPLLSKLLRKVADDAARWRGWMDVFNAYPIRYPALHPSLGDALSTAPEAAIDAYVDSIVLLPHRNNQVDEGRRNVTACLRTFRDLASDGQRRLLWRRAHDRWSKWAFDAANDDTHLLGVCWSELDYAVVGFAVECLDETGRTEMLATVASRLGSIEYAWHASGTDARSAWFRALSSFQPYAYATCLTPAEDWLLESRTCYPSEVADNAFLALRYPTD